jgi:hypothetical protein
MEEDIDTGKVHSLTQADLLTRPRNLGRPPGPSFDQQAREDQIRGIREAQKDARRARQALEALSSNHQTNSQESKRVSELAPSPKVPEAINIRSDWQPNQPRRVINHSEQSRRVATPRNKVSQPNPLQRFADTVANLFGIKGSTPEPGAG